jgi:hypothetical protein
MNKQDYIISNLIAIKRYRNIIENDLLKYWISQKYTPIFLTNENFKYTNILRTYKTHNGFDIGYDVLIMK